MPCSIKLKLELNKEQIVLFHQFGFAKQMFRNHSVEFLRKRYKQKRLWIKENKEKEEYITWQKEVKIASEKLKVFKKNYKTKEERKKAEEKGLKPVFPKSIHPLLDDQISSLSTYLTEELEKTKVWLMKNLVKFSHIDGVVIPKNNPKSIYEFYNALPFKVRQSLSKQAQNEKILLYLLQAPRGVFDQTILDLKKTYKQAYDNLKKGVSVKQAGFPCFKKVKNYGSIRVQLDARNKEYTSCWDNQELFVPSLGVLSFRDQGYILPESYAKMITIRKTATSKFFATFFGTPAYNEKRLEQRQRSKARKPIVAPATSIVDFLDNHTASFDINRKSGFPVVVSNIEQENIESGSAQSKPSEKIDQQHTDQGHPNNTGQDTTKKNYTVSFLDKETVKKINDKMKRKDKYIRFQQRVLARQDSSRKQQKKKGRRNPNGLHHKGKHSARRNKTQAKINFAFEALNNLKDFYLLALAQKMVQGKQVVFIEDLDVKGLLEQDKPKNKNTKHHQNDKHSQYTACFGKLLLFVKQECDKQGIVLLKCGRYDPTSQLCHLCGFHWGKLDTSIKEITCDGCGITHNRDYNATQNIKFLALYRYVLEEKPSIVKKLLKNNKKTSLAQKADNRKSLGERLNEGQTVNSLSEISHEELMLYIKDHYPIEKVIKALPKEENLPKQTCGKRYHARFSKKKAA